MYAKEKQSWRVDNWRRVIFRDEYRIGMEQGNYDGTFV